MQVLLPPVWPYQRDWLDELRADNSSFVSLLPRDLVPQLDSLLNAFNVALLFVRKFNTDDKPRAAISWLAKQGSVDASPTGIVRLLFEVPGVDMKRVGVLFGCYENLGTLKVYLERFDFANDTLDEALHKFLHTFFLPDEGSLIDRILECFAVRYFSTNTTHGFLSVDAIQVLSFGLLLLSTSWHNPRVKNTAMTLAQYIEAHNGVMNGQNPPRDMLERLYRRYAARVGVSLTN